MRKNHQPIWFHKLVRRFNQVYVKRWLVPHFEAIGHGFTVVKPKQLKIFGRNIIAGKHLHIICDRHKSVELTTWQSKQNSGEILIGDYVLLSPGVQISAAEHICIGDNCMIGADTYISDCDWHGTYNRIRPFRCSKKIMIADNVWIGHRAIIGKGVTIGKNSIVAAGSVVVNNVEANTVVGGNPARLLKTINPDKRMLKRTLLFSQEQEYNDLQMDVIAYANQSNTSLGWLRSILFPNQND